MRSREVSSLYIFFYYFVSQWNDVSLFSPQAGFFLEIINSSENEKKFLAIRNRFNNRNKKIRSAASKVLCYNVPEEKGNFLIL